MTKNPLDPIQTSVKLVFAFVLAMTAISLVTAVGGSGAMFGFGSASVCVEASSGFPVRGSEETLVPDLAPGAGASVAGVRFCAHEPSGAQQAWHVATKLPSFLVFAVTLSLAMLMFRAARRHGVFVDRFAARLRIVGWVVLAGSVTAALVEAWARQRLLQSMVDHPLSQFWLWDVEPSILAIFLGTLLISFARVLRISARMREDLTWTV
ncbi:hypothetical protein [Actinokineospora xionganensis]|uniref:DUF2975 domain-containing protein n=1 Tax=Actinokineospora xionganensis TaxID=2684470 RepID=A0ABR7L298_9PSEU|nr:hypothetical protein [Actinokineospora xionganensis]MBC6446467.1 hypothetical protein [Actinokineospora xionganensis]